MLHIPSDSRDVFTICGIDPGTTMLGFSHISIDIRTFSIIGANAFSINANKLTNLNMWLASTHGDRFARIQALSDCLLNLFNDTQPLYIASESPFIHMRRPQAYGALSEVVYAVKQAVSKYDRWKELILIPPSTVKQAVKASGNAQKDVVKQAVCNLPDLNYNGVTSLACLDEHAIDAIAVAYGYFNQLKANLCLQK